MDIRFYLALLVGKLTALILKLKGSGATAAPGLYALYIDPRFVKKFAKKLKYKSIIVTGTNGKTTTARLASEILSTKYRVIHNRQGSNLLRGIASTFIKNSSISGKINSDLGLWEVDEATLSEAIQNLSPKTILLLNLFRDQLDRYGEVDTTRLKWHNALSKVNQKVTLILNTDDPGVEILTRKFKGKVIRFGVEETTIDLPKIKQVSDINRCPNCASPLKFTTVLSAHMGHYFCQNCKFKRSIPDIHATNLKFNLNFKTLARFTIYDKGFTINYNLPGLYNIYNVLAAAAIGSAYEVTSGEIKNQIQKFSTAFGRFQKVKIGQRHTIIFLIKNPTGANEVLRILSTKNKLNLLVILNDKIADGRDVSWIWDTNWEILKNKTSEVSTVGIRAWDMATRLKYAGFKLSKNSIYKEISYSILDLVKKLNNNDTLIILPTYTALLETQKTLHKMGTNQKWHEQ